MPDAVGRYRVQVAPAAEQDLDDRRAFDARPIVRAIWALENQAETPTRNRKPLRAALRGVPRASWEMRVGDYRILYEVTKDRVVRILRVIFKGRLTIDEAAGGNRRE